MPTKEEKMVDLDTSGEGAEINLEEQKDESVVDTEAPKKETEAPKPISWVVVPDGSCRSLLVLQGGQVLMVASESKGKKISTFLELSSEEMIVKDFEEGLLGLVFHPQYRSNGLFYLFHTLQEPKRSVLVERRMKDRKKLLLDETHHRTLIEIEQPYWNHNSGVPEFGPDGYLYLSTGDGGKANDPHDFSQNTFSLLGKVLRIDVDKTEGALEYGIPEDNPFKNKPYLKDSCLTLANLINKNKVNNIILLNYSPELNIFLYWLQQLIAESLGKNKKGFLPLVSKAPKDHHSLLQLYLDGPRDKIFYIFSSESNNRRKIKSTHLNENFRYLNNKDFGKIKKSQKNALLQIFKKNKIPFREFKIKDFSENTLGELFSYFMLEISIVGKLAKINPYDQPAVEEMKLLTKKLLS